MSAEIWKFQLRSVTTPQEVQVPCGSRPLIAREQFGNVCVWMRCPNTPNKETRLLQCVLTGQFAPPQDADYLGLASIHDGNFIVHVFDLGVKA